MFNTLKAPQLLTQGSKSIRRKIDRRKHSDQDRRADESDGEISQRIRMQFSHRGKRCVSEPRCANKRDVNAIRSL